MVANYRIVRCISRDFQALTSRIGIMKGANYTDMEGGQLNGNRRWPTIRIWKEGGQLYGYGRWPTIGMWKVTNYRDNEGDQL